MSSSILFSYSIKRNVYVQKNPWKTGIDNKSSILKDKTKERQTGLEPATPTLARSYSTNWATVAYDSFNKRNFTTILEKNQLFLKKLLQ